MNNGEEQEKGDCGTCKEELAKCEAEKAEYLAGWQRAKADYMNYKKDELARLSEISRYGTTELVRELITVLDNFDLAMRALEKAGPVEKGIYLIRSQLDDILKKNGVERIRIKAGDSFDPSVAEAIAEGESPHPPGSIVEEIEPGYKLYGKILRPARVKVAKSK
ncbi:nucleotide exchange factor GrpE [Candidatus Parcubacteria bacterium]|nr:MAG: nucleotide exchange factor GrpE [Candidatus Parcubacteria bacterium]